MKRRFLHPDWTNYETSPLRGLVSRFLVKILRCLSTLFDNLSIKLLCANYVYCNHTVRITIHLGMRVKEWIRSIWMIPMHLCLYEVQRDVRYVLCQLKFAVLQRDTTSLLYYIIPSSHIERSHKIIMSKTILLS